MPNPVAANLVINENVFVSNRVKTPTIINVKPAEADYRVDSTIANRVGGVPVPTNPVILRAAVAVGTGGGTGGGTYGIGF